MKKYSIRGRYDCDGDEIPPIIKEDPKGNWVRSSDIKETIILSAIKIEDNVVAVRLQPNSRHCWIIHALAKAGMETPVTGEQGFLTSTGRFVDRVEAKKIAIEAGQIKESQFSQLYSEDVW